MVITGVAILLGLGFWQLQRLSWKTELNQSRLAAARRPPIVVGEDGLLPPQAADFVRLRAIGKFNYERQAFVLARTAAGEFGYHLLTPLELPSGEFLIVDRGWLPDSLKGEILRASDGVVEGYVRGGTPKKNFFVPNNDAESGFWSHINIPQMAAAMGIEGESPSYYLHASEIGTEGRYPRPQPPQLTLRNEHLQYAITWFAMAIALLTVFLVASHRGDSG